MKWKRLIAISTGLLLYAMPASAEFLSAQLSVNGLSCPFCAFGIEKKLLDVPGVIDVEVFLDEGLIALKFERGSEATVHDLERAVHKAGFELAGLSVETSGEIQHKGDEDFRWVAHSGMTFRLAETVDGREQPVSTETLGRLRRAAEPNGDSPIIEGSVTERDSLEPLLVISEIASVHGHVN